MAGKTDSELLALLVAAEGFESEFDLLESSVCDSVVPAICGICESTMDSEPDARENYCDNCGANAVQSGLVLAGII